MPKLSTKKIVPYQNQQIFEVMLDIEKYPEVLHFIKEININEKSENQILASVKVGIDALSFSYDCKIKSKPNSKIEIIATTGPFEHLYAVWEFKEITENKTEVSCFLDSKFKSQTMELFGGKIFAYKFQQAIEVFESYLKRQNRQRPNSN